MNTGRAQRYIDRSGSMRRRVSGLARPWPRLLRTSRMVSERLQGILVWKRGTISRAVWASLQAWASIIARLIIHPMPEIRWCCRRKMCWRSILGSTSTVELSTVLGRWPLTLSTIICWPQLKMQRTPASEKLALMCVCATSELRFRRQWNHTRWRSMVKRSQWSRFATWTAMTSSSIVYTGVRAFQSSKAAIRRRWRREKYSPLRHSGAQERDMCKTTWTSLALACPLSAKEWADGDVALRQKRRRSQRGAASVFSTKLAKHHQQKLWNTPILPALSWSLGSWQVPVGSKLPFRALA